MAWDSFKKNLKEAVGPGRVSRSPRVLYLEALMAPIVYVSLPTMLGLNEWPAWFTGTLSASLVGALFGWTGMTTAAIGLGFTHAVLSNFHDPLTRLYGREPWNFGVSPRVMGIGDDAAPVHVGPGGVLMLPDGTKLPTSLPTDTAGMSGYYPMEPAGVSGYYPTDAGMSGYFPTTSVPLSDPMAGSLNVDPMLALM